jgi:Immunoglobulin domain
MKAKKQNILLSVALGLCLVATGCVGIAGTLHTPESAVAPTIGAQPASQSVTAGQPATFSVSASGTAPLTYQWQKNGVTIGGNTASYTTPPTTSADNGTVFRVSVTNAAGSIMSNAATLTVNAAPVAPSITSQPASVTVTAGQAATFNVSAGGTAPLSYQWQRNGTAISGATGASYTTPATTTAENGSTFAVVVTNSAGSVTSSSATLSVNPAPAAPGITTQPASVTVIAGQPATFSVTASGTAPLSYQWQKNGAAISGATSSSYTTPATTSADNGSTYAVVVSNAVGSVTSNTATLTVSAAAVAPTITTEPANQSVTAGQTAAFFVVATGTAPLSYVWQKNGVTVGGNSASYTTPATTAADNGATFVVVVSNSKGSTTSTMATLTVNPALVAPSITAQPASVAVTAGQTATFSVVASGTAPLSYQWQKNGAAISGATSAARPERTTQLRQQLPRITDRHLQWS